MVWYHHSAWCAQLLSLEFTGCLIQLLSLQFTGWLSIAVLPAAPKSLGAATSLTSWVRVQMANPVAASTFVTATEFTQSGVVAKCSEVWQGCSALVAG